MFKEKKTSKSQFITPKTAPYFFVAPFIIAFLVFYLYPLFSTLVMSFQTIEGIDKPVFVGLSNYIALGNEQFYAALRNSSIYTLLTLIVLIPLPLILAVLINNKVTRLPGFFKAAYFLPALTSVVVAGLFFRYAFSAQETAFVNQLLIKLHMQPKEWLFRRGTTMVVLVLFCTWRWLGVNIIYFLSGLNAIPAEQYEAASIDGASALQRFRKITLPNLKSVTIYVLTISIYGGFSMFAESYTMFGSARSPGDIGLTLVSYIYLEGFNFANFGLGSAIGVTLFFIIMTVTIIQLCLTGSFKKREY